ncbi:MAG: hypothetical protein WCQ89_03120 [Verrucomicrobiota bacterium]
MLARDLGNLPSKGSDRVLPAGGSLQSEFPRLVSSEKRHGTQHQGGS